jgi:tRNA1Val (adenine37-N6)-methyltransferase
MSSARPLSVLPDADPRWPDDASRDLLVGGWSIYQRRGGHRTSTDDVLTAWYTVRAAGGHAPARYLDLGCGIGSVLLLVAHRLRPWLSVGIEAQEQSVTMARRTIAELDAPPALEVQHGDFRELPLQPVHDLVSGSPPYFPVGTGVLSPDAQRRACRFELRGGVEAYCEAAASALAPEGRFVLVFPTLQTGRLQAAVRRVGLYVNGIVNIRMRTGGPFLSLFRLSHAEGLEEDLSFAVRDLDGSISAPYRSARSDLGLP